MAVASFTGLDPNAITALAAQSPIGSQKAMYSAQVASGVGTNPIFEIRAGSTVVYRTTIPGTLTGNASGISLPETMTEPPTVRVANALTGADVVMAIRHQNGSAEITVPLKVGGDLATSLIASKGLTTADLVRLSGVILTPPNVLDVTAGGQTSTWLQTALTDMRKDPATGSYSYMSSYAVNDHKPLHRTERNYSAQYDRANLVMGRYPNQTAFTSTNPDYQSELSYLSSDDPRRFFVDWNRIIPWAQIFLSEEQTNSTRHAPGFIGNTAVLMWDVQLWVKKNGVWSRLQKMNPTSSEAWRPSFQEGPSSTNNKPILNWNGTGFTAFRPDPTIGLDSGGRYWVSHPYGGMQNWDTSGVQEVISSWRSSLVVVDSSKTDDRDFSRYLMAVGCDYYAPQSTGGAGTYLLGMGTSRHKYVRAKYPAYQWHVGHTCTWDSLSSSHPDVTNF